MEPFNFRFFQVVAIIILSFIVLVAGPHVAGAIYSHTRGEMPMAVELATQIVLSVYFILLPLLYIFMQKEVRVLFLKSLRFDSLRSKCILCFEKRNKNGEKPESNAMSGTWL